MMKGAAVVTSSSVVQLEIYKLTQSATGASAALVRRLSVSMAVTSPPLFTLTSVSLQHPVTDAIVVLLSWLLPFWGAGVFLHGWLFRDYELKRRWVQLLFAATFATSVNLLILALYEILGVMEPAARWLTWRVVLVVLSVDLVSGAVGARDV